MLTMNDKLEKLENVINILENAEEVTIEVEADILQFLKEYRRYLNFCIEVHEAYKNK